MKEFIIFVCTDSTEIFFSFKLLEKKNHWSRILQKIGVKIGLQFYKEMREIDIEFFKKIREGERDHW